MLKSISIYISQSHNNLSYIYLITLLCLGVSQAMLAGVTMTGSLPYNFQNNMTPLMGARDISGIDPSSGYPTPR